MRILHVTPFYEPVYRMGGITMATASLARGQAREGASVTVFTTNAGLEISHGGREGEDRGGVKIHYFSVRRGSRALLSREFFLACVKHMRDFDIVHVHGLWSFLDTCGAWAARRARVPYVLSPHGSLNHWAVEYRAYKKRPYWWAIERRTVLGSSAVHFTTPEEATEARAWIDGRTAVVIPVAVEAPNVVDPLEAQTWRLSLGVPAGAPLVGFLGRIHPIKGLDLLIDAVARVEGAHLLIAGPDEEGTLAHLIMHVAALGIHDRVHWTGLLDEVGRALLVTAIDVFVLPSHSENFGLAAAEAMAAGIPVVVTPGVNLAAAIVESGAGRCVPRDAESLARTLAEVLDDRPARIAMGAAGQRLVEANFSTSVVARRMLALYQECLA